MVSSYLRGVVQWGSRGIGLDETPGCFVCGGETRLLNNIAALLAKEDEEAALACFERGARMAYYHADPQMPQIKVGACDDHLGALQFLSEQWFISPLRVARLVKQADIYRRVD